MTMTNEEAIALLIAHFDLNRDTLLSQAVGLAIDALQNNQRKPSTLDYRVAPVNSDGDITKIRVEGGFIYTIWRLGSGQMNSVFVPDTNKGDDLWG